MYNKDIPPKSELPSTKTLIKSTIIAAVSATVILVTVVLPAEYGIDPTGVGKAVGLKKMGEIKVSLAEEAAAERAAMQTMAEAPAIADDQEKAVQETEVAAAPATPTEPVAEIPSEPAEDTAESQPNHEMTVTLAPNEGAEIKVSLQKGKTVKYKWWTDKGRANYDIHGDSEELNINYHNYSKGSDTQSEGILEAAFDGYHGWFWRNRTSDVLSVTIQTIGDYTEIKKIK